MRSTSTSRSTLATLLPTTPTHGLLWSPTTKASRSTEKVERIERPRHPSSAATRRQGIQQDGSGATTEDASYLQKRSIVAIDGDKVTSVSDAVNDGLIAEAVWTDPLSVIVPARHPLLAHGQVRLNDALKFPLVLCHPEAGSGGHYQIEAVLEGAAVAPKVADRVTSLGVMLTLVGVGFAIASQVQ